MTATRSTQEEIQYKIYQKKNIAGCPLCNIKPTDSKYISESKHFQVIRNDFPYSIWDGQKVTEHLMIVPKDHRDTLIGLPEAAFVEYMALVTKYENSGYNIYTRSKQSVTRSVIHHHTHFIRSGSKIRFVLMTRWPFYVRLSR